jgi:hypothetical protein
MDAVKASGVVSGGVNPEASPRVNQATASPNQPHNPATVAHDSAVSDFDKESNPAADDRDDGLDGSSVTRPILGVIVATGVLYFGKDILLPLAMASILAVAFRLQPSGRLLDVSPVRPQGRVGGKLIGNRFLLDCSITLRWQLPAGYSTISRLSSRAQGLPAWLQTIESGVRMSNNG